jgi:sugar phosphate isomerase/epimerase
MLDSLRDVGFDGVLVVECRPRAATSAAALQACAACCAGCSTRSAS